MITMSPSDRKKELEIREGETAEEYTRRMGKMIDQSLRKRAIPFGGANGAADFIKEKLPHYSDKGGHKKRGQNG